MREGKDCGALCDNMAKGGSLALSPSLCRSTISPLFLSSLSSFCQGEKGERIRNEGVAPSDDLNLHTKHHEKMLLRPFKLQLLKYQFQQRALKTHRTAGFVSGNFGREAEVRRERERIFGSNGAAERASVCRFSPRRRG